MNLYIGNLPHSVSEDDLRGAFQSFGTISTVTIIKDKFTGESRGFAFVEMPKKEEAEAAMRELNGADLQGRSITVSEARPRKEGGGAGGGGGRRMGGGGGGGGRHSNSGGYRGGRQGY